MASCMAVLTKPESFVKAKNMASCMAVLTKPESFLKGEEYGLLYDCFDET